MGWPEGHFHLLVILWPLVFVAHHHGDGGSQRHAIHHAAEDFHLIGFFARCRDATLTRLASVQFSLDGVPADLQPRWTTLQDDANPAPVGFPKGADTEQGAETAAQWNAFTGMSVRELRSARSRPQLGVGQRDGPAASRSHQSRSQAQRSSSPRSTDLPHGLPSSARLEPYAPVGAETARFVQPRHPLVAVSRGLRVSLEGVSRLHLRGERHAIG